MWGEDRDHLLFACSVWMMDTLTAVHQTKFLAQAPAAAAPRTVLTLERRTAAASAAPRLALHSRRSVMMAAASGGDVPAVVQPAWLRERLGAPNVRVLDASWYLPPMGRDAVAEHAAARIPGAQFWDTDGIADLTSDLPHMMPSEAAFAAAADALGVANEDTVVIYDGLGLFSAPRAWWTWRAFGHARVAVLEGGLPAWRAAGLPVEEGAAAAGGGELNAAAAAAKSAAAGGGAAAAPKYKAKLDPNIVVDLQRMRTIVDGLSGGSSGATQVMDARPAGRFKGADPEPRPGLRGGHMPGAKSVPFTQVRVRVCVRARGGGGVGRCCPLCLLTTAHT
jgi:thiosulfate/3-mercaptopyruvate sulfurtransferase